MAGVKGRSGGQNAKTQEQLALSGTKRKDRHSGFSSPKLPKGMPTPPKALKGEALEEWNRMCARLSETGALATVDDASIYQAACHFAETEDLVRLRDETGASIAILEENLAGIPKEDLAACFQEITKLRQLEAGYTVKIRQGRMTTWRFLNDLGLTAASRGRVKLPEKPTEVDPFARFDGGTSH